MEKPFFYFFFLSLLSTVRPSYVEGGDVSYRPVGMETLQIRAGPSRVWVGRGMRYGYALLLESMEMRTVGPRCGGCKE